MKSGKTTRLWLVHAIHFTLLVALVSSCGASTHQSGADDGVRVEWSRVGIGGGGAQFNPAVSPHDSKVVFVSCDMGGSYATCDGGASWRMFNLGGMVRFFVFDPVDPDVVYAQSSRLFKSEDKGVTWRVFYPRVSGEEQADRNRFNMRQSVQALAIDPVQSKQMYAAIGGGQSVALYVSSDGGDEWTKEKDFDHDVRNIFIDPSSPTGQRTLYVTSGNGVEQRINGKWQMHGLPDKNVKFNFFTGGYDAGTKKFILYAISGKSYYNREDKQSGIFISDNGGKSWENRQDGLLDYCLPDRKNAEFTGLATGPLNPETLYVSYNSLVIHADTACMGVAKSDDYGKTWTLSWQDRMRIGGTENDGVASPNMGKHWMNEIYGPGWGGNPFTLSVSTGNANVCYGTDFGRTVKTENGGRTWECVNSNPVSDGTWTTRGLDVTTCYQVVFDPFDKNHFFIATTDIGLQETKTGGEGWYIASTHDRGTPRMWENTTYWLTFDPAVKGRIWAVMSRDHDLPEPKMFRNGGVEKYLGGVALSNDGGATWTPVSKTMGEAAATHILLDPTSNKNARTLYVCAFGKGVYKSTDGGMTWTQKNKGIEGAEPFAWHIERRESDGALFLIVSRRNEGNSNRPEWNGALYKSTDGAESWTKMTLPEGCTGPADIVTTKKYPKRLVLATRSGPMQGGATSGNGGGGIFISDDEGMTWTHVMDNERYIYGLVFDLRNNRFYACGFGGSAYYSEDGAITWTRIRGYNFRAGHRVDLDPRNPEMIFITTFGGGVWYGSAKGDPEAIEDIIDN